MCLFNSAIQDDCWWFNSFRGRSYGSAHGHGRAALGTDSILFVQQIVRLNIENFRQLTGAKLNVQDV